MGDKIFIPLTELKKKPNGEKSNPNSVRRVVKSNKVQSAGEHLIQHTKSDHHHGITCVPNVVDGQVVSIDVKCACGEMTRIVLKYDDQD